MRYRFLALLFILACQSITLIESAYAIDKNAPNQQMPKILASFKKLQLSVANTKRFLEAKDSRETRDLLIAIRARLHGVDSLDSRFSSPQSTESRLSIIKRKSGDAIRLLGKGERAEALYYIREIANDCTSCHRENNVAFPLSHDTTEKELVSPLAQGEVALVSGNYREAEAFFADAIKKNQDYQEKVEALWKWALVTARYLRDAKSASNKIGEIKKLVAWHTYENELIVTWVASFNRWSKRDMATVDPLPLAEKIIGTNAFDVEDSSASAIDLLFLSGLLEKKAKTIPPLSVRIDILFYLGAIHTKLPSRLTSIAPETYLERCIREAEGNPASKRCYTLLKSLYELYPENKRMSDTSLLDELREIGYGRRYEP